MESTNGFTVTIEATEVINYALQQNGVPVIRDIYLKNQTECDKRNLLMQITTDIPLLTDFEQGIEVIHDGEELHLDNLNILIKGEYLASLTEKVTCIMTVRIYENNQIITEENKKIQVLAYDEWPGLRYFPDLLVAFVTPNHPFVSEILHSASKHLEQWTESPSLDGYQSNDPNRVIFMAAAVYAAIQEKNIVYAVPPSSFEEIGQRVRLCDTIKEQNMGTCLDLTLLYAACLLAMGLNPIMILMKGHIFAGVWAQEKTFADSIMDDPTQIEKRMSDGIHELFVVECTTMCAGKVISFDEAQQIARDSVAEYYNFVFAIDVARAIASGVTPIPIRIKTETGYKIEKEERKIEVNAPKLVEETFSFDQARKVEQANKLTQWEHKLLDLSLRNMLINMRLTKSVVPLLSGSLSDLEDTLADGEEFQVLPRPLEWDLSHITQFSLENTNRLDCYTDLIRLECKHKRLHTIYAEKELNSTLTKLYRSAKTSMEENGASTLYLALGLLRWFESKQSTQAHYAPLVLLPVEIKRKSASKGFVLSMRDEDPQINITLLELLKQDFDIVINGLNPIPRDNHGIDMTKIFAAIRHAIMDEPMWEVIESGFLGNFSFSQFVMWNDIHSKSDVLSRNKIVNSLMEGVVDWDDTITCESEDEKIYVPITVDASQLHAINMAAHDISFVLHGPPGTGKSQTITAMIANALAKRKTVLFVAEKLVALQVVEKRLNALGIGDFCLELHSNKANKKDVLKQLKKVLEMKGFDHLVDYEDKIKEIQSIKHQLDGYVKELHCERSCGYSLKELIDFYEELPEVEMIQFDRQFAMNLTKTDLEKQQHLLERLLSAGETIHHPHNHPLAKVKQTQYSMNLKLDLAAVIEDFRKSIFDFKKSLVNYTEKMKTDVPASKKQIDQVLTEVMSLIELLQVPDFLICKDSMEEEFKLPLEYLNKKDSLEKQENHLLSLWDEAFIHLPMDDMEQEFSDASKKIFGKNRALNALSLKLQSYAKFEIEIRSIPSLLTKIKLFQKEEQKLIELEKKVPNDWNSLLQTYSSEDKMREYKIHVQNILNKSNPIIEKIKGKGFSEKLCNTINEIQNCKTAYDKIEEKINHLLMPEFMNDEADWFEERLQFCDIVLENSADLKEWIIYQEIVSECQNAGLNKVCQAYENGLQHNCLINTYKKGIYQAIIYSIIEQVPILNSFTGSSFNERISQFKDMDKKFTELTRKEIYWKLVENLPSSTDSIQVSKELNILRKAITSNGRGISIRSLFDQIPNIISRLCPCILMSSISVAQYFSADNILYDIVIFDEASQLPTCKAVGVLARGKNAVIVGDPNQMPPTRFFAGNTIDEDNLDIEDLDSILDDCLALGMPQAYLKWHYRSRHESLIAFSNHEFYDNRMFTFPSKNDRERRVSFRKIEGYFDRGKSRQNKEEAKAIVQEILKRYYDEELKQQSIGVVTFNINQESLINDLLQEEFQKNSAFDAWANDGDEVLIVKNLENIQGDERDVILFSIAFGPDSEGKISMNFGPINKEGGWKRLNVAVSRARYEMIVFSTMQAKDIDLSRTKSVGVKALKNFLEFADKGKLRHTSLKQQESLEYGELRQICVEIGKMGYHYQINVGQSQFKIDIAVIDPYHPNEYLLGILLDGVTYKNTENTRDREISQIDILNDLGWEIHRIWTMDWWDNKDKEIAKLKQILYEKEQYAKSMITEDTSENLPTEEDGNEVEEQEVMFKQSSVNEEVCHDEASFMTNAMVAHNVLTDCEDNAEEKEQSKRLDEFQIEIGNSKFSSPNTYHEDIAVNLADCKDGMVSPKIPQENKSQEIYKCEGYISAMLEETTVTLEEYASIALHKIICDKIMKLIEIEAPISHDMLIKKVLNSFGIRRVSPHGAECTEKAIKKLKLKANRQNGIKFYWRNNQNPDDYLVYRVRINDEDKKSPGDICQQELKNAICYTLQQKHSLTKEELVKETVKVMGYSRRGTALVDAVERGYKYARKMKVIEINEKKEIQLIK